MTDFDEWFDTMPKIEGVRPVDDLTVDRSRDRGPPSFRRRGPIEKRHMRDHQQQIISLVREDGVLRWRPGAVSARRLTRRAGGRAALPSGKVVKQFAFEALETSNVYTALTALDRQLTPQAASAANTLTGLRQLVNGKLVPLAATPNLDGKRVLLLVHGTFSNSESLVDNGLAATPSGKKLLSQAESRYDYVLAYDHPTLSVSPAMNAFDLASLFRPAPKEIDIICHSRGGLVARWLCEAFTDPTTAYRVVLVGAPLAGTSLASPPKLRNTLDLLTNIADILRTGADFASANPFFLAASGLLRVVSTITSLTAKTPILDGALALIPGLDAMSHTGNNEEIRRLRMNTGTSDFTKGRAQYFAIQSDFEPEAIGWNFLRLFSRPMLRAGDVGADLIFDGPNDLVVDTFSMSEVADHHNVRVLHDFGKNPDVHHCNYFVQGPTVKAISKALEL
ncbi:MAG: hypothetical protein AAF709_06920 [Pseudomonadota bacterium]